MEIRVSAYMSEEALEILNTDVSGEILMVNSSGIYLGFGESILFLCDSSLGIVPNGIAIEKFDTVVRLWQGKEGQRTEIQKGILQLVDCSLRLQQKVHAKSEERCGIPNAKRTLLAAEEVVKLQKKQGISMLAVPLLLGEGEGYIRCNLYCTRAYPLLLRLMNAISGQNGDEIRYCVDKLLGLGTGLTPSADDVMLGMLYGFRKLPQKFPLGVSVFRESIWELSNSHTNRISSAYLNAILRGAYFERMEDIWRGLCGRERLDITRLTQVGSNSGAEMLLGMLLAIRIWDYTEGRANGDNRIYR